MLQLFYNKSRLYSAYTEQNLLYAHSHEKFTQKYVVNFGSKNAQ